MPAGIGVDERGGTISPVHTRDDSGVIHIESPTRATFSLAQFFSEWQVTHDEIARHTEPRQPDLGVGVAAGARRADDAENIAFIGDR